MTIQLVVLSDIHATDTRFRPLVSRKYKGKPPGKGTWLDYADSDAPNPLAEFKELIAREQRVADYLVVPGDVSHQANGAALAYAWSSISEIATALGAAATIATTGNHDIDSRYRSNSYDPSVALKELQPGFPVSSHADRMEYWANGVTSLRFANALFVVVDSCRFQPNRVEELDHGRISPAMLNDVRARLEASPASPHNVLVCHHHPHPFPMGREEADDRMVNGENLLQLLGLDDQAWLVIHGHRHVPRVTYASGGATSPVVFAAGSVAAVISPQYAPGVRNQAHFVTLESTAPGGMPLAGEVESWEFTPAAGWEPASSSIREGSPRFVEIPALPHVCGFGYRGGIDALAQRVASHVRGGTQPTPWKSIEQNVPEVRYLIPDNFQALVRRLRIHYRLDVLPPGFAPQEIVGITDD